MDTDQPYTLDLETHAAIRNATDHDVYARVPISVFALAAEETEDARIPFSGDHLATATKPDGTRYHYQHIRPDLWGMVSA